MYQLSINVLTFENTFLVIDNTLRKNSFIEFLKAMVGLTSLKLDEIKQNAGQIDKLQVIFLRNVEYGEFQEVLEKFKHIGESA